MPPVWNVKDAFILDKYKKIIDFRKNNLHLISYSEPINRKLSKSNFKKIYTIPKQSNAMYITSYIKKLKFLHTHKNKKNRKKYEDNDNFSVVIKTSFKKRIYELWRIVS